MTTSSNSPGRFDKPGTTSDFTSTQFELIQLSHEWEKLRDQVERVGESSDVRPTSDTVEETGTSTTLAPNSDPTTGKNSDRVRVIKKPISDTEKTD